MEPLTTGKKYNKIAQWWHDQHVDSNYGVPQLEKAVAFSSGSGNALDVGCGAGGRFVRLLEDAGFSITGIDVSDEMIKLARINHPEHRFFHRDICEWETDAKFDFIVAWDSIFHLPFSMQSSAISKLCVLLVPSGVLIYTLGNASGEHTAQWHDDSFYYSSLGINQNLTLLMENGLNILHLELDQYPHNHVYVIATKP